MNRTIEQYIKGDICFLLPEIILSDTEIQISVEAGKTHSGTIVLTNDRKKPMKGIIYSSNRHIYIKEKQFVGSEAIVHYTIDATYQEPSDIIEGTVTIISDCGEAVIPVKATVTAASLKSEEQNVKNLFQFTDLAKEDPAKAVALFKSEGFERVLLSDEPWRYKEIYRNLLKGRSPSGALEEFLIAIHKKQPIQLSLSRLSFTYDAVQEEILDTILITKDLWGYTEIKVTTDAEFIELEHKLLWTDNFIGNQFSLQFHIHPEALKEGKNVGHIYLETVSQRFEIEVCCNQAREHSQDEIDRRKIKSYSIALLKNYLNFRLQKTEFSEYVARAEEVIQSMQGIDAKPELKMLECHLATMKGDRLKAKEILEEYETDLENLKTNHPVLFCSIHYLKALVYQEEATIQYANEVIREVYDAGNHEFIIFWFLIYMDKRYIGNRKTLLEDLKKQREYGCQSPMMYFEAMSIFQAEPELLQELDDFSIQTIHFGIRNQLVSEDVARQYAYLAGKERYYKTLIYHSLEAFYEKYPMKEILASICSILIKGHQRMPKHFKWYRMGVEAQLRVTELHEYYMYTIDETSQEPLPQPILLYFIYNSRLNDKKRAYLYARIVKDKASNPSIYRTYAKKIEQFALRQLQAKNISDNLAVLYEDLIENQQITEEVQKPLAEIACTTQIICHNKNMKGIFLVHKELSKEEYIPLVDGRAYLNVLTENAMYYFMDEKEQRYVASVEYEAKRLLKETDTLQHLLYETQANLYQYIEALATKGAYQSFDEHSASICRAAVKLPDVKDTYVSAMMEQLIYYYNNLHNNEALDYYLAKIDLSKFDRKSRSTLIDLCIQRQNFEKVLEDLCTYGYENMSPSRLTRMCLRLLEQPEEKVSEDLLLNMCLRSFDTGNRDPEILKFLIHTYVGPTERMSRIWEAARLAKLPAHELEEQILAQIMFSQKETKKAAEIFLSFYQHAAKTNVSKAFLNYVAARYLMKDEEPTIELLGCMKHEVLERKNLYSSIALLKYFAEHLSEVTKEERDFVDSLLTEAVMNEVILPQFAWLGEKIELPNVMRNKTWIGYRTEAGKNVKIYYRIYQKGQEPNGEYQSEHMTATLFGIYVRGFVLFYNEIFEYYFTEEVDGEVKTSAIKRTEYAPPLVKYNSQFEQLNDMLELFQKRDGGCDELAEMIERYVKKDYMVQHYFKMI